MGTAIIIIVIGLGVLNAGSLLRLNDRILELSEREYDHYERTIARNIASSGMNMAIAKLAENPDWNTGYLEVSFGGGQFSVSVADLDSVIEIGSTGTYGLAEQSVQARLVRLGQVPEGMKYALFGGGNLHLDGEIVHVVDDDNGLNADVHSNGNIHVDENTLVEGLGTYDGNFDGPLAAFQPNSNPGGLPLVQEVEEIPVPEFIADDYLGIATAVTNDNLELSGDITLGTRSSPVFWYVAGNLTISGSVSGYGAFLVGGNIHVNESLSLTVPGNSRSVIGLYAEGNLHVNENSTLEAQVWVGNDVHFNGDVNFYGTLLSDGNLDFNGVTNIRYRPANALLTEPIWGSGDGSGASVQVLSWQEY